MAKIFIPAWDEAFSQTLREKGLGVSRKAPHWIVARLALARSLQMPQFPDEELRKPVTRDRAYEIHMEQLTGENNPSMEDFTDDYRLLLSIYHGVDLFADRTRFIELLQRHIQRGMTEIRASWREGNDFHDYLYQEMFFERASGSQPAAPTDLSARLRRALGEIGVGAEVEKVAAGPRLTRFTLRLAAASDLDRLRKDLDKIPFELGIDRPATLSTVADERRVALDVPRPEREWTPVEGAAIPDFGCATGRRGCRCAPALMFWGSR